MSSYIHMLLAAERKAIDMQNDAKIAKMERLKQAREEAQVDINNFNLKLDEDFKEKLKLTEGKEIFEQKIMEKSKDEIEKMIAHSELVKDSVIDYVLDMVFDIKPNIHINYQI